MVDHRRMASFHHRKREGFANPSTRGCSTAADEDPKLFFAHVDGLTNTLKSVGVTKEEREITRIIIIRNLSDDYDVEKRGVLTKPEITRFEVEEIVRTRYAALQCNENSDRRVVVIELGKCETV